LGGFYTADFGSLLGFNFFAPPSDGFSPFDETSIQTIDWGAERTDIQVEVGAAQEGKRSIQAVIESSLAGSDAEVVYCDHGAGEAADFVAVFVSDNEVTVRLYHCKGAGGAAPGDGVGDVYEVCGQAVKSAVWAQPSRLVSSIKRRFNNGIGEHRFVRGDMAALDRIFSETARAQIRFEIAIVQPGISRQRLSEKIGNVLAATADHLLRGGYEKLLVIASA
jgi:hypothetical protein